jgi:hypothetical protein
MRDDLDPHADRAVGSAVSSMTSIQTAGAAGTKHLDMHLNVRGSGVRGPMFGPTG